MQGVSGEVPLTATELTAWASGTKITFTPWEFETLLKLSHDYVQQKFAAVSPNCPPPWQAELDDQQRQNVAKSVRSLWRS